MSFVFLFRRVNHAVPLLYCCSVDILDSYRHDTIPPKRFAVNAFPHSFCYFYTSLDTSYYQTSQPFAFRC